jgi:tRNA threonylcarbamoyladenosine biosynthesis protein TsaE
MAPAIALRSNPKVGNTNPLLHHSPVFMLTITLQNEQDTDALGRALADVLPPGAVVGLVGTLGAGKTRLVQAVATALGVPAGSVTSPTFVLVNEYRGGRIPVFHFDTYRLKDDDEFLELGPEEYFDAGGITFVEWADRVEHLLPKAWLEIELEVTGNTTRRVSLLSDTIALDNAIEALRCRF